MKTSRRPDPARQKAKRQKVIVAVGAVILLALIGFELPKVLSHGKSSSTDAPAATATTVASTETTPSASDPAAAAPTPSGAAAQGLAAAPLGPARLSSQSGASASDGQLVAFTLMKSKDPFHPQLTKAPEPTTTGPVPPTLTTPNEPPVSPPPTATPPATTTPEPTTTTPEPTTTTPEPTSTSPASTEPSPAPPPPPPPPSPTTTEPSSPPPTSTTPGSTSPTSTTPEPTLAKPPVPTVASLSVNGVVESVKVDGTFPAAKPLFKLVSLEDGVAKIGIADGTLEGSTQTVALPVGKSVTLMNTADGMRYVVKLISVS